MLFAAKVIDQEAYIKRFKKVIEASDIKQKNIELLRKENESFSKLIFDLIQNNKSKENIEIDKKNVNSLIIDFSKDPDRVLDITLEYI